jgi:hypothetical protein
MVNRDRRWHRVPLLLVAGLTCCSRTDLHITGGPVGSGGLAGSGPDAGVNAQSDAGEDGASRGGSDAAPAACNAGSLLPGPTNPTWTISVQQGLDTILEDVYAVAVASDGAIFAVGCGDMVGVGQGEFTSGAGSCFLIKLDANGRALFVDRFVDTVNDPLTVGLADDHHGGVLVGLRYDAETDLGGTWESPGCGVERVNACGEAVWTRSFPELDCGTSFAFAGNGSASSAISGSCGAACNGGSTVVSLDDAGTMLSRRTLQSAAVMAAALQSDGTLFVGGYGAGPVDFGAGSRDLGSGSLFFATYGADLTVQSVLSSADYGDEMQAVATLDGSGFVVAGVVDRSGVDLGGGPLAYSGPSPTGGQNQDIFLARLTTQLGHVFSHGFGDTSKQDTTSLCVDADGTVSWVGLAGGETSFGGLVVSGDASMSADGFLARFGPDAAPQSAVETPTGVRQLGCIGGGYLVVGNTAFPAQLGAGVVATGGYIVKRSRP